MYKIIQKRKIWFSISGTLVVLSIISVFLWGLNFGIDFTGGSLLEVNFTGERLSVIEIQDKLGGLNLKSLIVQPIGESGMILRFQDTSEEIHQEIITVLGEVEEMRFDSVGPSIGEELKKKSVYSIIIVLIAIIMYIAWVFRAVSKPVASWKYGLSAIIALFHDTIIVLGVFAVLGEFFNIEINTAFIAAILTVLGYSVNDTIVVFDRVRENLPKSEDDFEGTVNTSINQTITRSINTSVTTLLVLVSILLFGGDTIKGFVMALAIGVFIGTYSSIFLASPILVMFEKKQ